MSTPANQVTFQAAGDQAVVRTAEAKLREADDISVRDYLQPGATDTSAVFWAAFKYGSDTRTYLAPNGGYWGIGRISVPKGYHKFDTPISFGQYSQLGMEVGGDSAYASTMAFALTSGAALSLRSYVNVHDLLMKNTAAG